MVIVINDSLQVGLKCNTAAVLALTLGKKIDGLIDKDLVDGSGELHVGLTNQPLPILKSTEKEIKNLKKKALGNKENILIIDITDAAQITKNYIDYETKLKSKKTEELKFLGIALAGSVKDINSLTGNLSLLR